MLQDSQELGCVECNGSGAFYWGFHGLSLGQKFVKFPASEF